VAPRFVFFALMNPKHAYGQFIKTSFITAKANKSRQIFVMQGRLFKYRDRFPVTA
jgi:hypothetical protein